MNLEPQTVGPQGLHDYSVAGPWGGPDLLRDTQVQPARRELGRVGETVLGAAVQRLRLPVSPSLPVFNCVLDGEILGPGDSWQDFTGPEENVFAAVPGKLRSGGTAFVTREMSGLEQVLTPKCGRVCAAVVGSPGCTTATHPQGPCQPLSSPCAVWRGDQKPPRRIGSLGCQPSSLQFTKQCDYRHHHYRRAPVEVVSWQGGSLTL